MKRHQPHGSPRGRRGGGRAWVAGPVVALAVACAPVEDGSTTEITVPQVTTIEQHDTTGAERSGESQGDPPTPTTTSRPPCEYRPNEEHPLSRCDSGELVERVQGELAADLGVDLVADGYFGDRTLAAVRAFQRQNGLDIDGIVGTDTLNRLFDANLSAESPTRGIATNWFGAPSDAALVGLRDQGLLVIDYEICSGSVGAGQVRQIAAGDGTVFVDELGITEAGRRLLIGSVVEVKIGSGEEC